MGKFNDSVLNAGYGTRYTVRGNSVKRYSVTMRSDSEILNAVSSFGFQENELLSLVWVSHFASHHNKPSRSAIYPAVEKSNLKLSISNLIKRLLGDAFGELAEKVHGAERLATVAGNRLQLAGNSP